MKEKEPRPTEPIENRSSLTRAKGYAHRLREEFGCILEAVKERIVLGCGGILIGGAYLVWVDI
ncbi:MAG: hypothetical protein Q7R97_02110 [Candidatus Daviesbacteria bacterium]|nr:hypothetical protein [Candidatus Daviesbacteria bacterium]